jgi:hypothetical protein
MRIANKRGAVLAILALLLAPVGVVHAQLTAEPVTGFAGITTVDAFPSRPASASTLANIVVYDNTASPLNFGFASTDLAAVFGDELFTTGTGLLSGMVLSVFNAGSSLGPLLTANLQVDVFDAAVLGTGGFVPLGTFAISVNFGAGLNPGFYTLINITNLDPLNINMNVADIVPVQRVLSMTGSASRIGIASLNPPTVGASPPEMFIFASTVGPPAYYRIGTTPNNPGYRLSVAAPPVGTESRTWGQLKQLYR